MMSPISPNQTPNPTENQAPDQVQQDGPDLLALDFDGVICDGLREYFAVSWQTYEQRWQAGPPPAGVADRFMRLRPVIETGWEMPVLVRALMRGHDDATIASHWHEVCQTIVREDELEPASLAAAVDGNRDRWIAEDLTGWLALHRFYPGVIDRLKTLLAGQGGRAIELAIITTKEERFVTQLLAQAGLAFPEAMIFGKSCRRPKTATLQGLLADRPQAEIWFIEDMLPTLFKVAQEPALASVTLFLADWGYNTAIDRDRALAHDRLTLLSIEQFISPFSVWRSTPQD